MSINTKGGDDKATADNIRHGLRVIPLVNKQSGIIFASDTARIRLIHKLSDVQTIGEIVSEFLNERKHFESGSKYLTINDGVDLSSSITLEGDALEAVASLVGQDLTTLPDLQFAKDYGVQFDLIMLSVNANQDVRVCDYWLDVGVKLSTIPGSEDGEINYEVTLYSNDSRAGRIGKGHMIASEIFYQNGTVLNGDAPDGLTAAFTLGHGNNSYAVAGPPDILEIDPNATSPYNYFYRIRVDGEDVNPSDIASFVPATGVLTFTSNLDNNAKLELMYLVDSNGVGVAGQPPHLHSGSSFLRNWKRFQV